MHVKREDSSWAERLSWKGRLRKVALEPEW